MVKTSPSKAEGVGSIPGQGAKISHGLGPKTQNIKKKKESQPIINIAINSIKTIKMVHMKERKKEVGFPDKRMDQEGTNLSDKNVPGLRTSR